VWQPVVTPYMQPIANPSIITGIAYLWCPWDRIISIVQFATFSMPRYLEGNNGPFIQQFSILTPAMINAIHAKWTVSSVQRWRNLLPRNQNVAHAFHNLCDLTSTVTYICKFPPLTNHSLLHHKNRCVSFYVPTSQQLIVACGGTAAASQSQRLEVETRL